MLDVKLSDGYGTGHYAKINGEGEVSVVVHPHPPVNEELSTLPFRQYLTDDGLSTGDNDMRVNGSSTSVSFWIPAQTDYDLYIKSLDVLIADAGATLNQFGNIGGLSNGVQLCWESQKFGSTVIHEGLTTNFDFVRLAGGRPSFGSGNSSFKANNVSGTSEAFFVTIDLTKISSQWGLRLRKGTNEKLLFNIQDNVSGVDAFNAIAYGVKF